MMIWNRIRHLVLRLWCLESRLERLEQRVALLEAYLAGKAPPDEKQPITEEGR